MGKAVSGQKNSRTPSVSRDEDAHDHKKKATQKERNGRNECAVERNRDDGSSSGDQSGADASDIVKGSFGGSSEKCRQVDAKEDIDDNKDDDDDDSDDGDSDGDDDDDESDKEDDDEEGHDDTSDGESGESSEEELDVDEEGRVAYGGTIWLQTRCSDGLITPTEAQALLDDCRTVFTARAAGGDGYSAGCTFWVSAQDSAPTTALERMALKIFRMHTADAEFEPSTSGAEWWTQVIDAQDDIGFHWDRDYDMQADQGILVHPQLGTVTYLSDVGAPTVVVGHRSQLMASAHNEGEAAGADCCWPRAGRHLSFDGQLLHGAPSELARESIAPPRAECERADQTSSTGKQKASTGKQKASTSEQEAGSGAKGPHSRRVTFLVNIWCNHKPWGAEKLPPKIAQKLSNVDLGCFAAPPSKYASSDPRAPHSADETEKAGPSAVKVAAAAKLSVNTAVHAAADSTDAAADSVVSAAATTNGNSHLTKVVPTKVRLCTAAATRTLRFEFKDVETRLEMLLPWPVLSHGSSHPSAGFWNLEFDPQKRCQLRIAQKQNKSKGGKRTADSASGSSGAGSKRRNLKS
uniref:Uncharacterized protein n=1 Tax=Chrysotila carterae TaxID=13221 RepID=A0A7S4BXZ0_CHRCT